MRATERVIGSRGWAFAVGLSAVCLRGANAPRVYRCGFGCTMKHGVGCGAGCAHRVQAGGIRPGRIVVGQTGDEASSRCAPMEEARRSTATCGTTGTFRFRPAAAFPRPRACSARIATVRTGEAHVPEFRSMSVPIRHFVRSRWAPGEISRRDRRPRPRTRNGEAAVIDPPVRYRTGFARSGRTGTRDQLDAK